MKIMEDTQSASVDALISSTIIVITREFIASKLVAATSITVTLTNECLTNANLIVKNDFDMKLKIAKRNGRIHMEMHLDRMPDQMTTYSIPDGYLCNASLTRVGAADNAATIGRSRRYRMAL